MGLWGGNAAHSNRFGGASALPLGKINQTIDLTSDVPGLVVRFSQSRAAIPPLSCDLIDCQEATQQNNEE